MPVNLPSHKESCVESVDGDHRYGRSLPRLPIEYQQQSTNIGSALLRPKTQMWNTTPRAIWPTIVPYRPSATIWTARPRIYVDHNSDRLAESVALSMTRAVHQSRQTSWQRCQICTIRWINDWIIIIRMHFVRNAFSNKIMIGKGTFPWIRRLLLGQVPKSEVNVAHFIRWSCWLTKEKIFVAPGR